MAKIRGLKREGHILQAKSRSLARFRVLPLVVGVVLLGLISSSAPAASAADRTATANPTAVKLPTDSWASANYDLSNTRDTQGSRINATNVSKLRRAWTFELPGPAALYGSFASTPLIVRGFVYLQDLDSNVYALNQRTGKLVWEENFGVADVGPNGLTYGNGRIYGATNNSVFALWPRTGKIDWTKTLTTLPDIGIDIAPQLYDNRVLISTVPQDPTGPSYEPGTRGRVYSLDAATGAIDWSFNTAPKPSGGGGAWYPPAIDSAGRIFLGIGNPAPAFNSGSNPNGASIPGRDLYTDSIIVLNGLTGKLIWFRQVVRHDVLDHDLQDPPVLGQMKGPKGSIETVIDAGKMGTVYAWNAANGQLLWKRNVGQHIRDGGTFPAQPVRSCPGIIGGVLSPMASSQGVLFVPWINSCSMVSATSYAIEPFSDATGGISAVDASTGRFIWQHKLPFADAGGATVANDVVFTADVSGMVYALSTKSGKILWRAQAPAGVNGFPAISKNMLIVGAGTASSTLSKSVYSVVAYTLR